MFRTRRVCDDSIPIDRDAVSQVQAIMKSQLGALPENDIRKLPATLRNPLKHRFRSVLFIAGDSRARVEDPVNPGSGFPSDAAIIGSGYRLRAYRLSGFCAGLHAYRGICAALAR
jgi:hypothetical protein